MEIDLKELRKQMCFTQAEMALELGIKPGSYAMIERGDRMPKDALKRAISKLQQKYTGHLSLMSMRSATQAPDVTELLAKAQLTEGSVQEQVAYCMMEISDLKDKLKKMKRRFDKALEAVNNADAQLRGITDEKSEMHVIFSYKRRKAMEVMAEIIAQNPARLMVKLEVLKQEQIIFQNALEDGYIDWLKYSSIG